VGVREAGRRPRGGGPKGSGAMIRIVTAVAACLLLAACQRTPGEVMQKVKYDLGMGAKPEGYVTASDKVMERLPAVGEQEMKRMNLAGRQGEVKFQDEGGLKGQYYRQVKVYESCLPLDATAITQSSTAGERGFYGYIQYEYRIYQSQRTSNRTEAAAAPATIASDQRGRETFRYTFGSGATWNGSPGELTRR